MDQRYVCVCDVLLFCDPNISIVMATTNNFALTGQPFFQVIGKNQNIQQFIDSQFKRDPWIQTDDSIIMPCRIAMMLRGIGLQLGHPVSVADWMAPVAEEELERIRKKREAEKIHDPPLP